VPPAKATPFAGGNEADVRRNRGGGPAVPREQKSRLLLAETKSISGKIAAGDFAQSNQFGTRRICAPSCASFSSIAS
jgi:hypothetical protein